MTTSAPPSATDSGWMRRFAAHLALYYTRRFITPFDPDSEYSRLDRWLTLKLLTHWTWWRIGGYMTPYEARTIAEFAKERGLKRIGQIGFLAGHFVCSALTILPDDYTVVSFDLGTHKHSHAAARWLERHFPGRSKVVWGSSRRTLRPYADSTTTHWLPFDLIIVDGDHSYEGAVADLTDVWTFCRKGTYVFMDDLGTPDGVAFDNGPARAWAEAIAGGRITPLMRFEDSHGHVFAVGTVAVNY